MNTNSQTRAFAQYLSKRYGAPDGGAGIFEKSDQPLKRRLNAVTPLSLTLWDEQIYASAFPMLMPLMRHVEIKQMNGIEDSPFIHHLLAAVTEQMALLGYHSAPHTGQWTDVYLSSEMHPPTVSDSEKPDAVSLSYALCSGISNRTSVTLTESYFFTRPAYGIVRDGMLVSVAAVNSGVENTPVADMCVETAVSYRGQGYAKANIAALGASLVRCGRVPMYRCRRENGASAAVAQSLGFRRIACEMTLTYLLTDR